MKLRRPATPAPASSAAGPASASNDAGAAPAPKESLRPGSSAPISAGPTTSDEPAVRFQPFLTDMVRVPAGTFMMGTDKGGRGDGPAHRVTITKAFYIDRTEVTAAMYATCVDEGTCTPNRVHADKDQARHPANCVDRLQAERFCSYAQKRLPTEAEWEYAARGTDGREYPWGNSAPTSCATAILSGLAGDCRDRKGTSEVGGTSDGRSSFGALDMAGNVWEWVLDGHEPYPARDVTDPKAPLAAPGTTHRRARRRRTGTLSRPTWGTSARAFAAPATRTNRRRPSVFSLPPYAWSILHLRCSTEEPDREPEERQGQHQHHERKRWSLPDLRLREEDGAEVDRERHQEDDRPEDSRGQTIGEHGRTLLHPRRVSLQRSAAWPMIGPRDARLFSIRWAHGAGAARCPGCMHDGSGDLRGADEPGRQGRGDQR